MKEQTPKQLRTFLLLCIVALILGIGLSALTNSRWWALLFVIPTGYYNWFSLYNKAFAAAVTACETTTIVLSALSNTTQWGWVAFSVGVYYYCRKNDDDHWGDDARRALQNLADSLTHPVAAREPQKIVSTFRGASN